MKGAGRPLRFLVLVFAAWIGLRTWQLWPAPPVPAAIHHSVSEPAKESQWRATMVVASAVPRPSTSNRPRRMAIIGLAESRPLRNRIRLPSTVVPVTKLSVVQKRALRNRPGVMEGAGQLGTGPAASRVPEATQLAELPARADVIDAAPPTPQRQRRWSASGWAMLRASGAGGGVATPQLGGAQAGVRIARSLDADARVSIVSRVAAALGTRQQEAAIGVEWRPTPLPVRVVAERRIGLAHQRGGTALGLVGGVSDRPLPAGFRLEGYAQAGAVIRDDTEGYADGALRVTRPVLRSEDGTAVALGLGAWGGTQRDAQRLDIGPVATTELSLGNVPRLRIALEWRQRVAGDARPTSGPALSISTDY